MKFLINNEFFHMLLPALQSNLLKSIISINQNFEKTIISFPENEDTYVIKGTNMFEAKRENKEKIFLADPYYMGSE